MSREELQEEIDGLEERILELTDQKKSAVACEDYVKAAELKTEIDNVTAHIKTISASMTEGEETPPKQLGQDGGSRAATESLTDPRQSGVASDDGDDGDAPILPIEEV